MEISLHRIELTGDFATLLFKVIDPSIPDHVVVDTTKGTHRTNLRKQNEAPVITSHFVINISQNYDRNFIYPTIIENNDYLPRRYMVEHINTMFSKHFTKLRPWISKDGKRNEIKEWSPRLDFGASEQATVSGVLGSGGKLKGVKWVEKSLSDSTTGDGAYPETERKNVYMNIGNNPSGDIAIKILKKIAAKIPFQKAKTVSVLLEDPNGKQKVVGVKSNSQDVLSAIFIPQEYVTLPMSSPLRIFEDYIHKDFSDRLKVLAK